MRGFQLGTVSVLALLALAGCSGPVNETFEVPVTLEPVTGEVEAMYACPIDRPCPGTTECVDGLCRDCVRSPQFCQ